MIFEHNKTVVTTLWWPVTNRERGAHLRDPVDLLSSRSLHPPNVTSGLLAFLTTAPGASLLVRAAAVLALQDDLKAAQMGTCNTVQVLPLAALSTQKFGELGEHLSLTLNLHSLHHQLQIGYLRLHSFLATGSTILIQEHDVWLLKTAKVIKTYVLLQVVFTAALEGLDRLRYLLLPVLLHNAVPNHGLVFTDLPNDLRSHSIDISRRIEVVWRSAVVAGLIRVDARREYERRRQGIVMRSCGGAAGVSVWHLQQGILLDCREALFELDDHLGFEHGLLVFDIVELAL
ncbi:hypothetical protein MRX96_007619 [Rhipicephalus microplus]